MDYAKRLNTLIITTIISSVASCLDDDLWVDILKRLPQEDIIRCRCVCRSWNFLISSRLFIKQHLNFQLQRINNTSADYLLFSNRKIEHMISISSTKTFLPILYNINIPILPLNDTFFRVIASLHGIICLFDFNVTDPTKNTIIIWNPSVCRYICLPQPPSNSRFISNKICHNHFCYLRFTFNPINNEYFFVRLMRCYIIYMWRDIELEPAAEVYSFANREWTKLPYEILVGCMVEDDVSSCQYRSSIDGSVCFIIRRNRVSSLVLFSVVDYGFTEIALPEVLESQLGYCKSHIGFKRLSVVDFKGMLSVLEVAKLRGVHWNFDMWSYFSDDEAWCKMFSVTTPVIGLQIRRRTCLLSICQMTNDQYVIASRNHGRLELILFDVETHQARSIKDCKQKFSPESKGAYMESLVLLDEESGATSYDPNVRPYYKFL